MPLVATIALLVCIAALALIHPPVLLRPPVPKIPMPKPEPPVVPPSVQGAVQVVHTTREPTVRNPFGLTLLVCALSACVWLAESSLLLGAEHSPLRWPVAALAAFAGYLSSLAARDSSTHPVRTVMFSSVWTGLVFGPAAVLVFFPETFGLSVVNAVWDLGGALPVHVAAGAAILAVTRIRRFPSSGAQLERRWSRAVTVVFAAGVALWICWIFALIGLDLVVDSATALIVLNGVATPGAAIVGWLGVERLRRRRTSLQGAVGGLVSGLVAVTAVGGIVAPAGAVVLGLLTGALCAAGAVRSTSPIVQPGRWMVSVHLLAGAVGLLWVGLFADGGGFIYTGQFSTLTVQLVATVAVAGWSYGVAAALSPILGRRVGGALRPVSPFDHS